MAPNFLTIDPDDGMKVLKGLASPVRARILKLLHERGKLNVNEISHELRPAAIDRGNQRSGA